MKTIVIGGTVSGVGKTTITLGLMAALKRRNLKIQPFKTGPDYIDTSHHSQVAGEPSRNLDTWMLTREAVIELFNRASRGKDIAVVEGVMGLFDGRTSTGDSGSTAELAKILGAPVILVLDCSKGARSIAAIVSGYKNFDSALKLGGVILNGIGSETHFKLCREAIEYYCTVPVMGYLPFNDQFSIPERHLGLIPSAELSLKRNFIEKLAVECESSFNLPEILRLAETAVTPAVPSVLFPADPKPKVVRIAVAQDKAFSFYYRDNLDLLSDWGAELVPFSPLTDGSLPDRISGIYIGGGFPEIYAGELAVNHRMKHQIKEMVESGMPVYGECGGLMYLGKRIIDIEGKMFPMVGAVPFSSRIDRPHLSLGYRTVKSLKDSPVLRKGEITRGHEFHWSVPSDTAAKANAYQILDEEARKEGYIRKGLLASYIHLHFGSLSSMAPRFVETCRNFLLEHG